MKSYRYRAKKGPREIVEGTLSAVSQDEAIDKVNAMGLIPVDIRENLIQAEEEKKVRRQRWSRIGSGDLLAFYRQMAKLNKSGVPLLQAVFLVSQGLEKEAFKTVLDKIHKDIREGQTFSAALAAYPKIFSPFDIGMIQTGEAAGRLDEVLRQIADYREAQRALVSKVRGALAYPVFVMLMGIFTVGFMLSNVIPKFSRFFTDLGQELPWITRTLIAASNWMQLYGLVALAVFAAGILLFAALLKNPAYRLGFDALVLKLPLAGKVILKSEISRAARTMELLLKSGIPILKALRIAVPVTGNLRVRQELEACRESVEKGGYLSEGLQKSQLFPAFARHFIAIGEESGNLDESLKEIAEWYEKDTEEAVKIMTSLLEPAMILIIGGLLGVLIIAVLLPVFSMNTMVS